MNVHTHAHFDHAARSDSSAVEPHIALLHQLAAASGADGVLVLFAVGENPATGRKEGPLALHFRIGDVDGMVAAVSGELPVVSLDTVLSRDTGGRQRGR